MRGIKWKLISKISITIFAMMVCFIGIGTKEVRANASTSTSVGQPSPTWVQGGVKKVTGLKYGDIYKGEDLEYSIQGKNSWSSVNGNDEVELASGTYEFRLKETNKDGVTYTASASYIVTVLDEQKEVPRGLKGMYGKIYNTTSAMEYSTDGTIWLPCSDVETIIPVVVNTTYQVRFKQTATHGPGSPVEGGVTVLAKEGTPAAPTSVVGGFGKLINTTAAMEYGKGDAAADIVSWKPCTDRETIVPDGGNYFVRYKETDTKKASGEQGPLAVTKAYSVTITRGKYMVLADGSGTETQIGLGEAALKNIIYIPEDGYYFDQQPTSKDGINITVEGKNKLIISGTPIADVEIELTNAVKIGVLDAPRGLSAGVKEIKGTTKAMEYASSKDSRDWESCSDKTTSVDVGTWYVRYKATDIKKASEAVEIKVVHTEETKKIEEAEEKKKEINKLLGDKIKTGKRYDVDLGNTYKMSVGGATFTGIGLIHSSGSVSDMSIRCLGELSKLEKVLINGREVDSKNYSLSSGSTIMKLKPEYLNSLPVGTHYVNFLYKDGWGETTFLVTNAGITNVQAGVNLVPGATSLGDKDSVPKTGESREYMYILYVILGLSLLYVIYHSVRLHKKEEF